MAGPNRGTSLIACTIIFGLGAFVVVALRIGYRWWRHRLDASDWLILAAWVCSFAQDVFNLIGVVDYGYGQHKADLPKSVVDATEPLVLYWLNQVFFKLTTLFAKLSLCIVYVKLFSKAETPLIKSTRWMTYFIAFSVVAAYGEAFFMSIFECLPVDKTWYTKTPGHCINVTKFRLAIGYVNVITSSLLIITPLPALARVRRHRAEVSQLMGLIILGLVHTGCTLARLILMYHPPSDSSSDPQWANLPPNTLAMVEMDVGIMAACLVVMRPCFAAIYERTCRPIINSTFGSSRGTNWNEKYTRASSPEVPKARSKQTGNSSRDSSQTLGHYGDTGIQKSIDIEMDNRSARSDEQILGPSIEDPFRPAEDRHV